MKKYKRLGIDIDDTIVNTNDILIEYALKYDKEYKEGKGFKDRSKYKFHEMFYWDEEERSKFFKVYLKEAMDNAPIIKDAREIINKLYSEGYEIYIVSFRRSKYLGDSLEMSRKFFDEHGIKYNKIITDSGDKGIVVKENNIDILIDDKEDHCMDAIAYGADALLYDCEFNKDSTLPRANSWKEVYEIIKKTEY